MNVMAFSRGMGRVLGLIGNVLGYLVVYTIGAGVCLGALGTMAAEFYPGAPRWFLYVLVVVSLIPPTVVLFSRHKRIDAPEVEYQGAERIISHGDPTGDYTLKGIASDFGSLVWGFSARVIALVFSVVVLGALILTVYYLWTSMTIPIAIIFGACIIGSCILTLRR
ncbi:hypothetical protein I5E68_06725 [Novosphingobium sp. YJ-S2-02]|uniref:Uncharacterized protein n=1 Tax=Novosphingobium aureum TaxID=2792964 RepID=A0A931MKN2_9SPHN|nr:hypothetical protein [Novosphingobium aureum]MBH0112644.1 hypothetical protein [Novosphingobium aureum]